MFCVFASIVFVLVIKKHFIKNYVIFVSFLEEEKTKKNAFVID